MEVDEGAAGAPKAPEREELSRRQVGAAVSKLVRKG